MTINKDTKICVSVASKPGNFGATVHNYCYEKLSLNFVYLPLSTNNISNLIDWVRNTHNAVGCSVSMPYKHPVISMVDDVIVPSGIGDVDLTNINTIFKSHLNADFLIGTSTDVFAIKKIMDDYWDFFKMNVCILGAGAMSDNFNILLYPFSESLETLGRQAINNYEHSFNYDVVINATPVGMDGNYFNREIDKLIKNSKLVIDCVVNLEKDTPLIDRAKTLKKEYVDGVSISIHQAAKQFEYYTGIGYNSVIDFVKEAIDTKRHEI